MITIDGRLTLESIEAVLYGGEKIEIAAGMRARVIESYEFLKEFSRDKVIYGINTGFGPMAQWRIDDGHLNELQYNIIRSHSTGGGHVAGTLTAALKADGGGLLIELTVTYIGKNASLLAGTLEAAESYIERLVFTYFNDWHEKITPGGFISFLSLEPAQEMPFLPGPVSAENTATLRL